MECFDKKTEYKLLNIKQKNKKDGIIIEYQYKEIVTRKIKKKVFVPKTLDNQFNQLYLEIKNT